MPTTTAVGHQHEQQQTNQKIKPEKKSHRSASQFSRTRQSIIQTADILLSPFSKIVVQ